MYFLGAVWSLFRVVYFLVAPFVGGWWIYVIVYAFPTNIQVAFFTLLLLFYAQRVHYDHWNRIGPVLFASYGLVNGLLLILFAVYASVSLLVAPAQQRWIVLMMSAVFAVCFALLVVGYVAYTVLVARQEPRPAPYKHESRTAQLALLVTITVCLTIRCVWDIINLAEAQAVHIFSDSLREQLTVVGLFLTWEILPLLSVIVFFGKIPHAAPVVVPAPAPAPSDASTSASGDVATGEDAAHHSYGCTYGTGNSSAHNSAHGSAHGSGPIASLPFGGRTGTMTSPSPSGSQVYDDEKLPLLLSESKPASLPPDAASVNADPADVMQSASPVTGVISASVGSTHHSHTNTPSFVPRGTLPLVKNDGSVNYCFVTQEAAGLPPDGPLFFDDGSATNSFVQF